MTFKYATQLAGDVRAVLERSTITADSVTLPPGQLQRELYSRVNKVLVAAGGKWNRARQAHLFAQDPRDVLAIGIETGQIVDARKGNQQFFTPDDLADRVIEAANFDREGLLVLEPSAGDGSLARAASRAGAVVVCVELDQRLAEGLLRDGYITIKADFLTLTPGMFSATFQRIVMNPPFANGQDIDHVTHAFSLLRPRGVLAAIMSAGVLTNGSKKATEFRRLVDHHCGHFVELPDDAFESAGTGVRTVLLTMEHQ